MDAGHPESAFTRVRIGNHTTVDLPALDDPIRPAVLEQVRATLAASWERRGRDAGVKGEIKTPRPTGVVVPHGDVMAVLDAYLQAGVRDVVFEGAPLPRPDRR